MEQILIIDAGSQYTQLIARSVRMCNTYCDIVPAHKEIKLNPHIIGFILSGSPMSPSDAEAHTIDLIALSQHAPILGICYGAQYITQFYGGSIQQSQRREFGRALLKKKHGATSSLLHNIPDESIVWMSHGNTISSLPNGFENICTSDSIDIALFQREATTHSNPLYGLQFHPEVSHSTYGKQMIHNFIVDICKSTQEWTSASFIETSVKNIQEQVAGKNVLMALSGGVDSSVASMLIHKAIGEKLRTVFVDNGLLRKNEYTEVLATYHQMGFKVEGIQAADLFYEQLKGQVEPESKRKIIGHLFIELFEKKAQEMSDICFLGQGTTYPDVIESVAVNGPSVTIKSHHNVGGLPANMNLKLLEPIRLLFKDEVRKVGIELGFPKQIIDRHPFPGPGLAIRIIGEVTAKKIKILQQADSIFIETLKENGWYNSVWQAGAILLPVKSVGVMGDKRTYENVVALRAVSSVDGMTADWSQLPHEVLAEASKKIINQVQGINRVVYDISSKPPSTIEWD